MRRTATLARAAVFASTRSTAASGRDAVPSAEAIPAIANQILGNDTTVPQTWPGDRFDLVWVFDWNAGAESYTFTQVPQLLLAGDSPDPIG